MPTFADLYMAAAGLPTVSRESTINPSETYAQAQEKALAGTTYSPTGPTLTIEQILALIAAENAGRDPMTQPPAPAATPPVGGVAPNLPSQGGGYVPPPATGGGTTPPPPSGSGGYVPPPSGGGSTWTPPPNPFGGGTTSSPAGFGVQPISSMSASPYAQMLSPSFQSPGGRGVPTSNIYGAIQQARANPAYMGQYQQTFNSILNAPKQMPQFQFQAIQPLPQTSQPAPAPSGADVPPATDTAYWNPATGQPYYPPGYTG